MMEGVHLQGQQKCGAGEELRGATEAEGVSGGWRGAAPRQGWELCPALAPPAPALPEVSTRCSSCWGLQAGLQGAGGAAPSPAVVADRPAANNRPMAHNSRAVAPNDRALAAVGSGAARQRQERGAHQGGLHC